MSAFDPTAYGSAFAELLNTPRIMALDPGEENGPAKAGLEALDLDAAFAPNRISDRMMAEGCRSALWLYHDFLVTSHTISQQITTPTGSYWHGIMHRREPDYPNGKHWFGRVGDHDIYPELRDEAATIASGTDNLPDEAAYLMSQSSWDPFAFIDLCEGANVGGVPAGDLCRGIQQREWELLFDYCYRKATA